MGYCTETGKLPQRYDKKDADGNRTEADDIDQDTASHYWHRNVFHYLSLHSELFYSASNSSEIANSRWPTPERVAATKGKALGIFACPSDARKKTSGPSEYSDGISLNYPSYGINNRLDNHLPGTAPTEDKRTYSTRPGEIIKNCILLIDCQSDHITPTSQSYLNRQARFRHLCRSDYDLDASKETGGTNGNTANALMWDGTIRQFKQGQLPYIGQTLGSLNGTQLWMPW